MGYRGIRGFFRLRYSGESYLNLMRKLFLMKKYYKYSWLEVQDMTPFEFDALFLLIQEDIAKENEKTKMINDARNARR